MPTPMARAFMAARGRHPARSRAGSCRSAFPTIARTVGGRRTVDAQRCCAVFAKSSGCVRTLPAKPAAAAWALLPASTVHDKGDNDNDASRAARRSRPAHRSDSVAANSTLRPRVGRQPRSATRSAARSVSRRRPAARRSPPPSRIIIRCTFAYSTGVSTTVAAAPPATPATTARATAPPLAGARA